MIVGRMRPVAEASVRHSGLGEHSDVTLSGFWSHSNTETEQCDPLPKLRRFPHSELTHIHQKGPLPNQVPSAGDATSTSSTHIKTAIRHTSVTLFTCLPVLSDDGALSSTPLDTMETYRNTDCGAKSCLSCGFSVVGWRARVRSKTVSVTRPSLEPVWTD